MEEDGDRENVSVPVPAGYHFRPYPWELVIFYLRRRLLNQPLPCQVIKDLNIYDFHPRDILGNTPAGMHRYFFTPRKMKYPNGTRPARGTTGGYWKASGKDMIIKDKNKKVIGHKKFLVFHEGHQSNGKRTNWLMHEYTINEFWFPTDQNKNKLGALALCEIYLKPTSNKPRDGELEVEEEEEEEEEEEGPSSHSLDNENMKDNIFDDRLVRPRPASCNHDNDRGKTLLASTSGCPLDSPSIFSPITENPRPPIPFISYDDLQRRRDMMLMSQTGLRLSGLLQPASSYHLNRTTMPVLDLEQPSTSVHSLYRPSMALASSSSQSGNSDSSSFRNQMTLPPQHMPHGEMSSSEISVVAASSSQCQVPPLQYSTYRASELMPSTFETSPQTTLWPLPRHLS